MCVVCMCVCGRELIGTAVFFNKALNMNTRIWFLGVQEFHQNEGQWAGEVGYSHKTVVRGSAPLVCPHFRSGDQGPTPDALPAHGSCQSLLPGPLCTHPTCSTMSPARARTTNQLFESKLNVGAVFCGSFNVTQATLPGPGNGFPARHLCSVFRIRKKNLCVERKPDAWRRDPSCCRPTAPRCAIELLAWPHK